MYAPVTGAFISHIARAWSGKYMRVDQNQTDLLPWADYLEVMIGFSDLPPIATTPQTPKVLDLNEARFNRRVVEWKRAKGALSSVSAMVLLPAYQQIVGMGEAAVPLILAELKEEGDQPDMWFWALKSITGEDPVPDEDRGDMVAMSKAWLNWGMENGVS
jgi:hypothetical protein